MHITSMHITPILCSPSLPLIWPSSYPASTFVTICVIATGHESNCKYTFLWFKSKQLLLYHSKLQHNVTHKSYPEVSLRTICTHITPKTGESNLKSHLHKNSFPSPTNPMSPKYSRPRQNQVSRWYPASSAWHLNSELHLESLNNPSDLTQHSWRSWYSRD